MTALDQAQAEQSIVLDVSRGWGVVVLLIAFVIFFVLACLPRGGERERRDARFARRHRVGR